MNDIKTFLICFVILVLICLVCYASGYYHCYKTTTEDIRRELSEQIEINNRLEESIQSTISENDRLKVELSSSTARIKRLTDQILKAGSELQHDFKQQESTIGKLYDLERETQQIYEDIRKAN